MKKFIFIVFLLPFTLTAQTAIGSRTIANKSVVLDFPEGTTKGIILPAVEELPTTPANGTFLFDKTTNRVKVFSNNQWQDLSINNGNGSALVPYSGTVNTSKQTIIGAHTTKVYNGSSFEDGPVNGVLVLEGSTKAMVLPKIANASMTVKTPYPGMMCYDTRRKALAIFDGTVWVYWK